MRPRLVEGLMTLDGAATIGYVRLVGSVILSRVSIGSFRGGLVTAPLAGTSPTIVSVQSMLTTSPPGTAYCLSLSSYTAIRVTLGAYVAAPIASSPTNASQPIGTCTPDVRVLASLIPDTKISRGNAMTVYALPLSSNVPRLTNRPAR